MIDIQPTSILGPDYLPPGTHVWAYTRSMDGNYPTKVEQEKYILHYCFANGLKVDRIFRETINGTAALIERPVFNSMLQESKQVDHQAKAIMMYDITRMARKKEDVESYSHQFYESGLKLIFLTK
jgi:DNA invertase Pin-like site-specific DNA recombinase